MSAKMFGSRRHRTHNPPLTAATANPNAATAAAAVFKRREASPPSLSAAAAAAALRARPITPTNVAEVQTKRTMRRSASVSSSGTGTGLGMGAVAGVADPRRRPGLQRRESNASMTERTFRSPSPLRPPPDSSSGSNSRAGGVQTRAQGEDAPPVPALPSNLETSSVRSAAGSVRQTQKQHRKAHSLGIVTTPVRVASQRLAREDEPSWFGAAKLGDAAGNVRRIDPAMASPPSSPPQEEQSPEDGRPSSRASVNFSYPTRMRSPPVSPIDGQSAPDPGKSPGQNEQLSAAAAEHQTEAERRAKRLTAEPGPASSRARPPSGQPDQSLVYDPNSRRMVPRSEFLAAEQAALGPSVKPSKSKKKKQTPQRAGSHLERGTMGRMKEDIPDAVRAQEVQPTPIPTPAPAPVHAQKAPESAPSAPRLPEQQEEESTVKTTAVLPITETKRVERQQHAQGVPAVSRATTEFVQATGPSEQVNRKHPAVAQDPARASKEQQEQQEKQAMISQRLVSGAIDAVPTRERLESIAEAKRPKARGANLPASQSPIASQLEESPASAPEPARLIATGEEPKLAPSEPGSRAAQGIREERTHSNSPARQAHFAPVQNNLVVRHSPPPRSISPRKSAMKQQSPNRDASLSDDASEASGSATVREELALPRKKSVRVSFDDEHTVVVGESASANEPDTSIPLSPQSGASPRRPWYSNITRSKKKDFVSLDDDEVMKPRPALPSFGSVRDRKPRERSPLEEERPLVRPTTAETAYSPPLPASPNIAANEAPPWDALESAHLGQQQGNSSDHAIGALLAKEQQLLLQEQGPRHAANISRFREPLPPVVTSVEGSGYASDTTTSTDVDESEHDAEISASEEARMPRPVTPERAPSVAASTSTGISEAGNGDGAGDGGTLATEIPTISISQPSPSSTLSSPGIPGAPFPPSDESGSESEAEAEPEQNPPGSAGFFDVPGGFPDEESDVFGIETETPRSVVEPPRTAVLEPSLQERDAAHTAHSPAATQAPIIEEEVSEDDESESSGIYSDAYEDLSEVEGDGFLSLDAVVESPISKKAAAAAEKSQTQHTSNTNNHQPETAAAKLLEESSPEVPVSAATAAEGPSPPATGENALSGDGWEKAKAYWRSLTAEKRAQLEKEAREDAGTEADLEEAQQQQPSKPKKKKSVERRTSERKKLAVQLAQQMMAQEEQEQQQQQQGNGKGKDKDSDRTYMIKPGTKWTAPAPAPESGTAVAPATSTSAPPAMRKSLRRDQRPRESTATAAAASSNVNGSRLRKSMRSGGSVTTEQRVEPAAAPSERPMSYPPGSRNNQQGGLLRRRGSDSSASSFKRSGPIPLPIPAAIGGQGFSLRKSMRHVTPPTAATTQKEESESGGKRFSLRALSPVRSPFRRSMDSPPASIATTGTMRQTLRGSPVSKKKSLSGSGAGGGVPTLRSGQTTGKLAPKRRFLGGGSKFTSRLGDSSDEEDGGGGVASSGSGFRSRFDDSSDEEVAAPTTLVSKAIITRRPTTAPTTAPAPAPAKPPPRVRNQPSYASTALPEEEEEMSEELPEEREEATDEKHDDAPPQQTQTQTQTLPRSQATNDEIGGGIFQTGSGRGGNIVASQTMPMMVGGPGSFSLIPDDRPASRRSSLMSALRRNKKHDSGKIARSSFAMDSAARRDTPLERTVGELRDIRGPPPPAPPPAPPPLEPPRTPRLQKRFPTTTHVLPPPDNSNSSSNPPQQQQQQQQQAQAQMQVQAPAVHDDAFDNQDAAAVSFARTNPPRSSGNLGTRTMAFSGSGIAPDSAVRPDLLLPRRTMTGTSQSTYSVDNNNNNNNNIITGPSGEAGTKKKRFGALRKMFHLDD